MGGGRFMVICLFLGQAILEAGTDANCEHVGLLHAFLGLTDALLYLWHLTAFSEHLQP